MIGLIADAVLPIAWILALGFGLKRYVGVEEVVWLGLEKISYWVLMPSLLVAVIIQAPVIAIPWASLLGSLYGVLGLLTLILLFGWLAGLFGSNYASFTSVYQGVIRFNTFISLALMAGLRPDLLPHLGISAATIIVVINIACVSVMTANRPGFAISHVFKELARNPLILACLIGGTCRVIGVPSGFPVSGMALVGQAALPMGVLCLGAGLQWRAVHAGLGLATFSVVIQLVIKPLLFWSGSTHGFDRRLAVSWTFIDVCFNSPIKFYIGETVGRGCTVDGWNCCYSNRVSDCIGAACAVVR